jgi:hypothetical protein
MIMWVAPIGAFGAMAGWSDDPSRPPATVGR